MFTGTPLAACDFVAVDLETTGCTPGRDRVIEIGAARLAGGEVTATFEVLVRPDQPIPRAVQSLTGITDAMVADATPPDDAFAAFADFADGAVLVAHNYRFDIGFLDHEYERMGGDHCPRPALDTLSLARRLRPGLRRFNLAYLAEVFEVEERPTHRAGADAFATARILARMLPEVERLGITTVGELAAFCGLDRQTDLASRLSLTAGIPDEPGVFALRDGEGMVLYVGKAKSLRQRTRSLFYPSADAKRNEMGVQVADIDAFPARSVLDAALLERRLLDRHDPPYNPASQSKRAAYWIHADTTTPTPGLRVVSQRRLRGESVGPMTSRWAAVTLGAILADVHGLRRCARRLTPRLAASRCDHRAVDCPSPCTTPADATAYAGRLRAALDVFDGHDEEFRGELMRRQQEAADEGRYEDAIRYRDGMRALERATGVMRSLRTAGTRNALIIEGDDACITVHLVKSGVRARVVRGPRQEIRDPLEAAVDRLYFSPDAPPRAAREATIGERLIVAEHLSDDTRTMVEVTDRAQTMARLARLLGWVSRTPRRRRHEAPAGA